MPGERSLLIDPVRCVGCKSCLAACAVWNSLPLEGAADKKGDSLSPVRWISVQHNYDRNNRTIMLCLHCDDAPCIEACPERAIFHQNGWVVIDRDKCIGCNSCVTACPYRAVHKDNFSGARAAKCDGCMSSYSELPRCAAACPTKALEYGYRTALIKKGLERAASYGMHLFGREEHGAQNVLRIGMREIYAKRSSGIPYEIRVTGLFHRLFSRVPFARFFKSEVHSAAKAVAGFFMRRL